MAIRLTDQLLDLTRSRLGGGIPIQPKRFAINTLVKQLAGEFELMYPEHLLRIESDASISGDWDRDRMHQLLTNILNNAVRHGKAASPVHLHIFSEDTEAVIEVTNEGEPIPAAMLPFIFEAYRQGRGEGSVRSNGLGLGLFIAREIAHAHRGSIKVASSAGDGTTFSVRIPRADPDNN